MRAPLFGVVVASCILCAFGCDRGEPEVQVGERPEEPGAVSGVQLDALRLPR
jgi:hypothetical protein